MLKHVSVTRFPVEPARLELRGGRIMLAGARRF